MTESVFEIQFKDKAGKFAYHSTETVSDFEELRDMMRVDLGAEFVRKYSGGWYRFVNIESGETYRAKLVEESKKASGVLQSRAVEAAIKFLQRYDYEVLDTENVTEAFEIVAKDENEVVFVKVFASTEAMPEETVSREAFERSVAMYIAQHEDKLPEGDVKRRLDIIGCFVLAPERALLRHHKNALGEE